MENAPPVPTPHWARVSPGMLTPHTCSTAHASEWRHTFRTIPYTVEARGTKAEGKSSVHTSARCYLGTPAHLVATATARVKTTGQEDLLYIGGGVRG